MAESQLHSLCPAVELATSCRNNARGEPRPEAAAERRLKGVGSTALLGRPFCDARQVMGAPASPTLSYLFRPHPDELLRRRLKPVRADELPKRPLDLGPGLRLFGIAEPDHELAQGQRSPLVLHGLSEGGKAPPNRHRVDGYLPKASRAVGVL